MKKNESMEERKKGSGGKRKGAGRKGNGYKSKYIYVPIELVTKVESMIYKYRENLKQKNF